MAHRTVEISQGMNWLTEAGKLIMANPASFLLIGLICAIALMIPLLGALAFAIFGPALYGGVVYAAREQHEGRKAEVTHLFRAFQQEGKLPKMLVLCLPGIAAAIVVTILAVVLLGGALLGAMAGAATESEGLALGALGAGGLIFFALALAVGFVAYALVLFAVPRVMFDGLEPFDAMKESFAAVLANIGAVLVFVVVIVLGAMVVSFVLGLVSTVLASLLVTLVAIPLVWSAVYFAWRDVFSTPPAPAAELVPPPPVAPQA